jgi:hypothetical protein
MFVMAGLVVPAIHALLAAKKTSMLGTTSPGMTRNCGRTEQ